MLEHGGQLKQLAKDHNRPLDQWIDLSTGINPFAWPVPIIPDTYFQRLPEADDLLVKAAAAYYKTNDILAIAGSQSAIQVLPQLRHKSRVAVPAIGYAEHQYNWLNAGHEVISYLAGEIDQLIEDIDVLIVINPNNPTAEWVATDKLQKWHQQLKQKGGWLIVDEAFIDTDSQRSMIQLTMPNGLIVLRSVGKFFGLAGIRSGFVSAEKSLLLRIQSALGPWAVTGPSQYLTIQALSDTTWIKKNRENLLQYSADWATFLAQVTHAKVYSCSLFSTIMDKRSESLYQSLARHGIYCRLLDNKQGLRFGLPKPSDRERVEMVLKDVFLLTNEKIKSA